jgi:NlpC/P60 family
MNAKGIKSKSSQSRASQFLLAASTAVIITVCLVPVSSGMLRLAWLAALAGLLVGLTGLLWKRPVLRLMPGSLALLVCLPMVLPGRPLDQAALRMDYCHRLIALEGSNYFWGGEATHGIDCSGLPRKALRQAMLHQGLSTLNGLGVRSFLENWWFDASAKALGQGYRQYTIRLPNKGTVRTMDTIGMHPGDLAVTADGIHVMVYLGDDQWIQADPGPGKVIIANARISSNKWFNAPITTHRWRVLSEGG